MVLHSDWKEAPPRNLHDRLASGQINALIMAVVWLSWDITTYWAVKRGKGVLRAAAAAAGVRQSWWGQRTACVQCWGW